MSRNLILVRHAKSDWSEANTADIDRPLKKRGPRDARLIGSWLNDFLDGHGIDRVQAISSPALRAQSTTNILLSCMHAVDTGSGIDDDIYMASSDDILDIVRDYPGDDTTLMLVGHNPGMHDLVERLTGTRLENFPTCAVACIEYATDHWKEVPAGSCKSWVMMRPKLLRSKQQQQD